ncbi:unnamed protein product [Mesocestoides corti]|uniref:Uncharacterized protein n=1 Tax=Mesocestoides corti TaxID=53468 RepID=A0A158QUL2_MESCO|nr:unnamed protein product [Mesocestoides corti]
MVGSIEPHRRSRSTAGFTSLPQNALVHDLEDGIRPCHFHLTSDTDEVEFDGAQNELSDTESNVGVEGNDSAFYASVSSSEFVRQLISVLFTGLTKPEPLFIEALVNDPPYGFFSRRPSSIENQCSDSRGERRKSRLSTTVRTGFVRLFSPIRKKSRRRRFRPSTVSLPAQMVSDSTSRGEHWWSMVQLADSVASRPTNDMENGESAARTSSTERRLSEPKPPALSPTPQSKETIVAPARGRPLVPTGGHATVAVKDETNIERLRKDAERLEAAIRNIRSRKSELSDWFFDQMLVAQVASDDGNLAGRTMPAQSSGADIKRSYKKRNAELTQKLAELEGRLSDTRLVISHLEGQSLPTDPDAVRAYISQILAENRRKGGGSATAPSPHVKLPARPADTDDTGKCLELYTSVSLTAPTPLATTAETPAVTEQPPQQSHHSSPRSGTALPPQSAVNATDIANAVPLNLTASEASESLSPPAKSRTLPQESDISKEAVAHALPVDATNSARVTRLRSALPPIGTQEERPSSGHSDPVTSTNFFGTSPPPPPQLPLKAPSSSKKPRNSARRAFSRLVKPFGRRSGSAFPSPPLKKSASEEHMLPAAAAFSPLNDGTYKLYKVPSASNARMLSPKTILTFKKPLIRANALKLIGKYGERLTQIALSNYITPFSDDVFFLVPPSAGLHLSGAVSTTSRSKKSIKLGNGGPVDHSFQLEPGASSKKSHAGSVSSGVAGRQSRNQQAESTATSGGSESCPPCNVGVGSSVNDEAVGIINVLDVLCGGGIGGLGVARSSVGNPVTSSGGGSTHSGGAAAPMSANGATAGPSSSVFLSASSTTPPPAYNVAMALVMLHQRSQALLEAHAEAQQKLISELREELTNLRQDLMETRNMVNTITVEVEALRVAQTGDWTFGWFPSTQLENMRIHSIPCARLMLCSDCEMYSWSTCRDMQTKEDVQSHTLSNAIARLEQLDASAEKLRQNVQQDLISIRNEQKHALEPLKYQLATETRDLRDMFTTLSNKVTIMEKCERLSNLDRDQPQALRLIANTMTNLVVSLFAFITALIQILIRFLNAGATVTNNRVSAIVLNVCILVFLLVIFLAEPLFRWWNRTDAIYPSSPAFQPPR